VTTLGSARPPLREPTAVRPSPAAVLLDHRDHLRDVPAELVAGPVGQ